MISAIRTENLSKRFRRTVALDGVNLDVLLIVFSRNVDHPPALFAARSVLIAGIAALVVWTRF
jgi:hypothetical protein